MPVVTVASVVSETQSVYLNDTAGSVYTSAILLPFIKTAFEHLRNELALNDIRTLNEVSAAGTLVAGNTTFPIAVTDVITPLRIEERAVGSTELWQPMIERTWVPNEDRTNRVRYWVWREEAVEFLGATEDRSVRIFYIKDLNPAGIAGGDSLTAANSRSYLSARTAALAAMFVQQNESLAKAANDVADSQLRKVIQICVKSSQALPTRRKPFLGPRFR